MISSPWRKPPPFNWRAYPFLGLAVALGLGIYLADQLTYRVFSWLLPLLLVGGMGCLGLSTLRFRGKQRRWLNLGLFILLTGLGFWRATITHLPNHPAFFAASAGEQTLLIAVQGLRPGTKSLRVRAKVMARITPDSVLPARGNLLLYFSPTEQSGRLSIGNQLLVRTTPERIGSPLNPHAFDAANYWGHQSIFHRSFVRDKDWSFYRTRAVDVRQWATRLRQAWLSSFEDYLSGDQLAVAAALVLGKRDLLTDDLRSAYADTGAVHVLAVSGLHVGIVAWIILGILGFFLPDRRWARWLKTLLAIMGIWSFALITGFSPSVQRAATMFSTLLLGTLRRRKTYLLNTLAGTAFILLCWQPQLLFQVGFQLSFAAVTGIGLFLRPIQRAYYFPQHWQRKIWSVLSVSIAAQIGTLPFSIYYFYQFPLYFLLSGSIVILTAYAALALGLLHGLLAWLLPALQVVSATVLSGVVWVQNMVVYIGRQLPGARQEVDWIFPGEALLLLLAILGLATWLKWRSFRVLSMSLTLILIFLGSRLTQVQALGKQQAFVIYHQPNETVIDVISGDRAVSLQSPNIAPDKLIYTTQQHRLARRFSVVKNWTIAPAPGIDSVAGIAQRAGSMLDVPQGRWMIFDGDDPPATSLAETPPYLLLINDASYFEVSQKINLQDLALIVVDGSNRRHIIEEWAKKRTDLSVEVVITAIDGAYSG
ncbi:MAG: ComEC/Rec2 family competence protein [Bacteroidota bacterium]